MLEYIYINYVLLVGTSIVSVLFIFGLTLILFNFLYDVIQAIWKDIKYGVYIFLVSIKKIILPIFRIWWIITRAPIFVLLIILNSLRYLISGTIRIFIKYWRSYGYVVQEDTMWDWEKSAVYYTNKSIRSRLNNLFKKYLARVYPTKYTRSRYGYTLTFLWGYWLRWCSYLIYLTFYYLVFLLRKCLYYIWIKPYVIEIFLFFFYYIYRTIGWWINIWFYKLCWNLYVFVRRQLYYFIPNWAIADIIQDLNLHWFEWNFEANISDEDDDTPEDLFMNNPNKKIVDVFYDMLPITNSHHITHINYTYFFIHYSFTLIFKYLVIIPIYLLIIVLGSILLSFIDVLCTQLVFTHKLWWNIYKYFLRQQYYLYIFFINITSYSWYKLLFIPFKTYFILFVKFIWWILSFLTPLIFHKLMSYIMALCFYMVYSVMWVVYYSPALVFTVIIKISRLLFRYRVIILSLFLGYYWVYEQYSELGALMLGIIQSTVEQFLRIIWFYAPIEETIRFTGSNKYEFIKYWGSLHNINLSRLIHFYPDVWNPDLAYRGYYQLSLLPEQISATGVSAMDPNTWPIHYDRQRSLKFYRRSFLEREQWTWNLWFFKFVEGTYIWDPAPHLAYELNQRNFNVDDFKEFFHSKYIYKKSGTPITDLFWFFQEDEMEKWDRIMDGLPYYYLFEPNVLQEEEEILPTGWFNWESWTNWFHYDLLNTAYLVPFDLPIEGSKQGAPGYQPGVRPPHLHTMLNSVDPIEYSRAKWRQKKGLPVLNSMHYVQMLYEFKNGLLSRKDQLIRISTELHKDLYIWDEIFSENTEWQMRLFTAIAYPFKWFSIRFELIRVSIYKNWVYTKAVFWMYYYYYDPKIRVFFFLSFIQQIIIIYPFKWLCFCWQLGNSVYPLPQKTVNVIFGILWLIYNYSISLILYLYKILSSEQKVAYLYSIYNILPAVWSQLVYKWLYIIGLMRISEQFLLKGIYTIFDHKTVPVDLILFKHDQKFFISILNVFRLTWWNMLYCELYVYLSLDQYYDYLLYKYQCYLWFWNHIIQGYWYLWQHSFYINEGRFSWFTFSEFMSREYGIKDRRIIHDVISDWKNILAYGYIREMGNLITRQQTEISWLKCMQVLCVNKDLGISFINYGFFRLWYWWDILCQIWHNLLVYKQTYITTEWKHAVIGWTPMLMVWMNKIQYWLDDIYIYLQLPRRLNKYGLSYTTRGYDLLPELNMMYVVRRTNFGYTRTWKSLNMLTYLVLVVKYPNTWEHFTILNNSSVFKNSTNGLRTVASKLFTNMAAWSSALYYITIFTLLFLSNSFRNLLFCTTGDYAAHTNNREFRWQSGRAKSGGKLNWVFVSREMRPWMKSYVDLKNKLELHMDYYAKLMINNNELPLQDSYVRAWIEELHTNTFLHKTSRGYNYKRSYLSPMYLAYLLNPHYYSLYTNFAYSSNNFNKFMGYAELRDISMKLAGENLEINRAYTEVHPTYLYHKAYIELHMKQFDKWYNNSFNLDKYLFDFNLPDWAWHRDGFNMRIFASKNPIDLTQQLTYVYEDERSSYIPWTIFGWFLAIPVCLVIKPLAGIGQWLQHSGKEEPAWAWHLSYYINNLWHHISLVKYFYYVTGPWIPETKLLSSIETEESEDYWHYHEQNAFLREFFYSYEEDEPVDIYQLLYTSMDLWWESSLEEVRLFFLISCLMLLFSLLFAIFKKNLNTKIDLSKIYYNQSIKQWNGVKNFLPIKHALHKIFTWFWQ